MCSSRPAPISCAGCTARRASRVRRGPGCLLCPLAVFAPRHATNLLRLKAFFSRQWRQMPAAQFMAVFGPYSQRIGHVLDRYDPTVLLEAAHSVGDHDSELPLRPEECTR
jgi:hypothetical protein